jgi:pyrroline-5-carboxylate reductase
MKQAPQDTKGFTVLLAGAGRMGGAMLRGWLASCMPPSNIVVQEPHLTADMAALLAQHGIQGRMPESASFDVIVLAMKPQAMPEALGQLSPLAGPQTLVLSIAAGRTIASIAEHFHPGTAIIRAMPNLPAEIGLGITAACANPYVSVTQQQFCKILLGAIGELVWIAEENHIDAVTAISGSGPAYVFHLTECLTAAGEAQGLDAALAGKLARATVTGSAELLRQSLATPGALRENVTSPSGTTAAALEVLMAEDGLASLMQRAVSAAAARSRQLSG